MGCASSTSRPARLELTGNDYRNFLLTHNYIYKNTQAYVPKIYENCGVVVKVYDGDTITVALKLDSFSSKTYRFQVRLARIDCPEIRSKKSSEKIAAHRSRDVVVDMAMEKIVNLTLIGMDKYGRMLCEVFVDGINLSDYLMANKYAIPYDGKTKKIPDDWRTI